MNGNRWKRHFPRYRVPVILQREHDGTAAQRGTSRILDPRARVLKRLTTTNISEVALPDANGPATDDTAPTSYDGWQAWWPPAPDTSAGKYKIPDPPTIARTVMPNAEFPILWEAAVPVGGSRTWTLRISAVYALVDWIPVTGSEKVSGIQKLSINNARAKMRPQIIDVAGINAMEWNVLKIDDDVEWKLEAIIPSYRRGEFVELLLERTR